MQKRYQIFLTDRNDLPMSFLTFLDAKKAADALDGEWLVKGIFGLSYYVYRIEVK